MTVKRYPLLLKTEQSISLIFSQNELNDEVFYFSQQQREQLLLINTNGESEDLQGKACLCPPLKHIVEMLKAQLSAEGHCCIGKMHITSWQMLFDYMQSLLND